MLDLSDCLGPCVPVLRVASVPSSLRFYAETLDFEVAWSWSRAGDFDGEDPVYGCVMNGESILFVTEGPTGGRAGWIFLELPAVEDVDDLFAELKERGAAVVAGVEDKPWGSREFAIEDPDGHRLQFSCPLSRTREETEG